LTYSVHNILWPGLGLGLGTYDVGLGLEGLGFGLESCIDNNLTGWKSKIIN